MCDPIQSIATRLRGLREALELTQEEVAASCNLPVGQYREMFGEEPKMNAYFITRAGKGVSVERQKAYKYEALAAGFRDRKIDPFIVTVEPAADDAPMHLNCHPGQEMNYVLEGRLLIGLNGKEIVLNTGDSLYFDSGLPHGMKALDGKTVRFLAIIM